MILIVDTIIHEKQNILHIMIYFPSCGIHLMKNTTMQRICCTLYYSEYLCDSLDISVIRMFFETPHYL